MKLGLIGATGVVGGTVLRVLEERRIPIDELRAYASRDRDVTVRFRDRDVPVFGATFERLTADANDLVIFASSDDASAVLAPSLVRIGAIVVDNSSTFRMDPGCPLVIPEVNPDAIHPEHRIFPVGNCTAIILCVALAPVIKPPDYKASVSPHIRPSAAPDARDSRRSKPRNRRETERYVCRADLPQRCSASRLVRCLRRFGRGKQSCSGDAQGTWPSGAAHRSDDRARSCDACA